MTYGIIFIGGRVRVGLCVGKILGVFVGNSESVGVCVGESAGIFVGESVGSSSHAWIGSKEVALSSKQPSIASYVMTYG